MFEKVNDKYGGVDVMVNAAGIASGATLTTGKTEDWRKMLDVRLLDLLVLYIVQLVERIFLLMPFKTI
jgi:NADP-dependent 3-hydroxy acid dehydrogenase YdfG